MAFKTTRQDAPAKQNHTKFPWNTSCIRQGKSVFSQGNLDSYFFEASSRKIKIHKKWAILDRLHPNMHAFRQCKVGWVWFWNYEYQSYIPIPSTIKHAYARGQGSALQSHIPGPRSSKCSLLSWKIPRNKRTWYFDKFWTLVVLKVKKNGLRVLTWAEVRPLIKP